MWYVLQTMTGREEALVEMVRKTVPSSLYENCFIAYYERVWRKQQQSIVHIERLFPGYVLIITDKPDEVFLELKHIPAMVKLLSDGDFGFVPLRREEQMFFQDLLDMDNPDGERIVRLSYVEKDRSGHVYRVSGPLRGYMGQVVKYQFKKRYAIIRFRMLGEEKTAALGIILKEDIEQELAYGKVEAPVRVPDYYKTEMPEPEQEAAFQTGDAVKVTAGSMDGMDGVVWKVGKGVVEIGVHLFGQDVSVEVPVDEVCKV